MIAQVSGTVLGLGPTSAVVELGGLGISVQCSPNTTAGLRIGQTAQLCTTLIVREDSLTLYGFASADERDFFDLLLTATGVGPKLAQAALAVLSPDELRTAITTENLVLLTKVPGIGRKGAQRIVIELKDKINTLGLTTTTAEPARTDQSPWRHQVSQGLQGLGWPAKEAEAACEAIEFMAEDDPPATVPVLMRAALQSLAKK